MNLFIYFYIFFSKVVENALGTLRLIVVANGKKVLGAILQLTITIVWLISTSIVIVDINKDPFKVIVFGLGAFIGSYFGSYIEEKIAFGNNILLVITNNDIANTIRNNGYIVTELKGSGMLNEKNILMIMISRKKRVNLIKLIQKIDKDSIIIIENAFIQKTDN